MFYRLLTSLNRSQKGLLLLSIDLFMVAAALYYATFAAAEISTEIVRILPALWYLVVFLPLAAGLIAYSGLHRIKLNTYGMDEIARTLILTLILVLTGGLLNVVFRPVQQLSFQTLIEFGMVFSLLSICGRVMLRKIVQYIYSTGKKRKRVLIYGAGQTGQQLAAALRADDEFEAACIVDDDSNLQTLSSYGLRVHSPKDIPTLVRRSGIERIVLAMPSADQAVRLRLAKQLSGLGCEVLALPSFADIVLRGEKVTRAAPVELTSLLGRDALETDLPTTEAAYNGQRILVTGAGGSIGSELCRQLIRCTPAKLVLLDHSEHALYQMMSELNDMGSDIPPVAVLGSVTNPELVREVLTTHQIDVIFHAAAYKHVNIVQQNEFEGVRNNVLGTRIVAKEARSAGVDRFVLVSSDKAVRPVSTMGSSKRLAELVVQDLATRSTTTKFSMVRFGNVLGSSGSVIPLFQKQIREGGPVTVTDSDVTRYFMTVFEAVRLVLLAGSFSRGGDVFVLDMGQPVSILSVAHKLIAAAGYSVQDNINPKGDIQIRFTGLKPGEKMHEELLIGDDMLTTPHRKILRAQENMLSELQVAAALQDLRRAIENRDLDLLKATLLKWVESSDTQIIPRTVVGEI